MAPEASSAHKTVSVPDSAVSSWASQQQAHVSRGFGECTSTSEEDGGCTHLPLPPADTEGDGTSKHHSWIEWLDL